MELDLAIMPSIQKHQADLESFFKTNITDPESMEEIGRQIGMKLVYQCPSFISMMKEKSSAFVQIGEQENAKKTSSISITEHLLKLSLAILLIFL